MPIEVKLEGEDLAQVVAALGRVMDPGNSVLYEKFYDAMNAHEKALARELYMDMEFSHSGKTMY